MRDEAVTEAWPDPVERVRGAARRGRRGADRGVRRAAHPPQRPRRRPSGASCGRIVKSLLFDCDGSWVLVLVPGDRRADAAKVARLVGTGPASPGAAQVRDATGFDVGAVAPVALARVSRILVERSRSRQGTLWVGAGSRGTWRGRRRPSSPGSRGRESWIVVQESA